MGCETIEPETLIENLKDAGCSEEFIAKFLQAWEDRAATAPLKLLSQQRGRLLEAVHAEQKKLDCLDYLRYRLEKHKNET